LSLIDRFIAAAIAASDGWAVSGAGTPDRASVGGFNSQEDAEFAVVAREAADELAMLYQVAKAIHARTVLGITFVRAAERRALSAALAKLES
jgi:hypothetical protein